MCPFASCTQNLNAFFSESTFCQNIKYHQNKQKKFHIDKTVQAMVVLVFVLFFKQKNMNDVIVYDLERHAVLRKFMRKITRKSWS